MAYENGITVTLPDGHEKQFNVVGFYVADLGHKTKVLGHMFETAKYGFAHSQKSSKNRSKTAFHPRNSLQWTDDGACCPGRNLKRMA